jgi:hypothetical protein
MLFKLIKFIFGTFFFFLFLLFVVVLILTAYINYKGIETISKEIQEGKGIWSINNTKIIDWYINKKIKEQNKEICYLGEDGCVNKR